MNIERNGTGQDRANQDKTDRSQYLSVMIIHWLDAESVRPDIAGRAHKSVETCSKMRIKIYIGTVTV